MLYVKNMVFLDGAIARLAPDLDLLAEVAAEEQHALLTAPRRKAFVPLAAKVEVYYEVELARTVIEVQCNDRLGLLFRIGRAIQEGGYAISIKYNGLVDHIKINLNQIVLILKF
jgi:UTP:GlnB (protein PII) uridylyltransferase